MDYRRRNDGQYGGGNNSSRKMTPKGQMSSSGSGPAIMMMPPHIRATFMPDPPLKQLPPPSRKRPKQYTDNGKMKCKTGGVAQFMAQFERGAAPDRVIRPTPAILAKEKKKRKKEKHMKSLEPLIDAYKKDCKDCQGEFMGMNCYHTLFVGRLAYEVTERKLLREFETYGSIQDVKLIFDSKSKKNKKSRGYAFIEYEQEEDMKRAYRAADGMRVEGRDIVVDVERGHTVPNWLPRRLGGGLGGTRFGGADKNITAPGRFDPSKPSSSSVAPPPPMPPPGYGGPPPHMDDRPPPYGGGRPRYGNDRGWDRGGGGGYYGHPSDRYGDRGGDRRGGGGRYYGDRGGGGSRYGDRGMKRGRSRSRSPDRYHRRGRY